MQIFINDAPHTLPEAATLADAVAVVQPAPPFAAARNRTFVPRGQYAATPLADGDRIDLIAPVTGG